MPRPQKPPTRYTIRPLEWEYIDEPNDERHVAADIEIRAAFIGRQVFRFWHPTDRRKYCESKTLAGAKRMAERIHRERLAKWLEPVEERGGS